MKEKNKGFPTYQTALKIPFAVCYSPRQPVCGFYRHAFCATRMQHISFFLLIEKIELMAKAKSKRAAPTHKTKRHAKNLNPKLSNIMRHYRNFAAGATQSPIIALC